jgi:hypothetical protein
MRYAELRQKQQKRVDDLPLGFAFSNKQFDEMIKKFDLEEGEKVVSIGMGGYIRKRDVDLVEKVLKQNEEELDEFLKDEVNLFDALVYELSNHEYNITYNQTSALKALGLDESTMTDTQRKVLRKAKRRCM